MKTTTRVRAGGWGQHAPVAMKIETRVRSGRVHNQHAPVAMKVKTRVRSGGWTQHAPVSMKVRSELRAGARGYLIPRGLAPVATR